MIIFCHSVRPVSGGSTICFDELLDLIGGDKIVVLSNPFDDTSPYIHQPHNQLPQQEQQSRVTVDSISSYTNTVSSPSYSPASFSGTCPHTTTTVVINLFRKKRRKKTSVSLSLSLSHLLTFLTCPVYF